MNILHRALCICIVSNIVHSQFIIPDISRLFSRLTSMAVASRSDRQFRRIRCQQMPWLEHCRRRRRWRAERERHRNPEVRVSTWVVDSNRRDPRDRTDPMPPLRGEPHFPRDRPERPERPIDPPFRRPDRRDPFDSRQSCNISCPRGSHLHAGECQYGSSLCNPACQDGYSCSHGRCHRDPCRHPCGPGLSCRNARCVDANVCRRPCCQDEECKEGQCIPVAQCDPVCPDNFICHNGHCDKIEQVKRCIPECPPNFVCHDGHCDQVSESAPHAADTCPQVPCGPGEHCHNGHCEPDNHGQLPDPPHQHSTEGHHHNSGDHHHGAQDHRHNPGDHHHGAQDRRRNSQGVAGRAPNLGQGDSMFLDPVNQGPVSGISGFQDPLTGIEQGPGQFGPGGFGSEQFEPLQGGPRQRGPGQGGPRQNGQGQNGPGQVRAGPFGGGQSGLGPFGPGQGGLGQFGPRQFGSGQGVPGPFGPGRGGSAQMRPGFPPPGFPQGGFQTRISPFGNPQQATCPVQCMAGFRCISGRCVPVNQGGNFGGSAGGMPLNNVFNFPTQPQQQGNMGGNTPTQNQNGPANQFQVAPEVPLQTGQPQDAITDQTVRNFLFPSESNSANAETASFTDPIFGAIST